MKKTCRRCRALTHGDGWIETGCDLGYPQDDSTVIPKPVVECPKPLTNAAWMDSDSYKKPEKQTEQVK